VVVVNVTVELPVPGAVIDAGLKPTVTPEGAPEAVSEIAEFSPPETEVVTVEPTLPPAVTETEAGDALIVNAGVCDVPPPVSAAIRPAFGLPQPVTRSYPATAL
jgi:hypothetical protein